MSNNLREQLKNYRTSVVEKAEKETRAAADRERGYVFYAQDDLKNVFYKIHQQQRRGMEKD